MDTNGGNRKVMKISSLFALSVWMSAPTLAQNGLSDRDIALLPEYCKYAQSFPQAGDPQREKWKLLLGPTFNDIHHYCYGLNDIHYAKLFTHDAQQRAHLFRTSVGQIQYVIDRAPQHYILLPEMYTKKGESLMALGKAVEAIEAFQRAIDLKPDYWPPYADLGDYYMSLGDRASARAWLERGLASVPDSQALQRRLGELNRTGRSARNNGK